MSYPFKLVPTSKEQEAERAKVVPSEWSSLRNCVISQPGNVWMPKKFPQWADAIYNFELRPDDVWIVTYPKCGTTWTQEMVWQLIHNVDKEAAKIPLFLRSPFLEMPCLFPDKPAADNEAKPPPQEDDEKAKAMKEAYMNTLEYTAKLKSPRVIKTHLPLDMLPPKLLDTCKVVYVCRNPKDCCVSFYHHTKLFDAHYDFQGTFEDFANMFLQGTSEYGSYWYHLKGAWEHRDHPNMKFLWFEDMKKDLIGVIKELCKFLNHHLTQLKILELDDHLYIDNFRKLSTETFGDPKMVKFFRKGTVGDWKNYFTGDHLDLWNKWIDDNTKGTDISFQFHIDEKKPLPIKWVPCSEAQEQRLAKMYGPKSAMRNCVISQPGNVLMPKNMARDGEKIYNFELRPDDIWIVTYPKCGTTWTQEMVWQIVNNINVGASFRIPLSKRSPFLEFQAMASECELEELEMVTDPKLKSDMEIAINKTMEYTENLASPRVIKTHLPFEMLPPKLLDTCKVLYVCRNPKDCCVSFYHHTNLFTDHYNFQGDFNMYAESFQDGLVEFGSYWHNLKVAWKLRNHPNMKFLWFEDMKKDLIPVIRDVASFLGRHLTEMQIIKLDDHLYIDNFRKITAAGADPKPAQFFRKGKVGDWKNHFTGDSLDKWNKWIEDNLKGTDIVMQFEH